MPQETGPGFTVQPQALRQDAATACELASDLAAVRSRWVVTADNPGEALGYASLDTMYRGTQDTWFDEIGVYIRVLEELCQAIQTATGAYQASDTQAADQLRGAR
jgi:hypothetical protein